jgi:uncharacterized protein (TIRG00374 family)
VAHNLSTSRWLQLTLGLALSAFFLWLAVRGEDWSKTAEAAARTDWRYIALMVVSGVYGLYARCQRWRFMLERATRRPLPMGPIFSASAVGFMANMVLPFRVGEVARPYLVARHTGVSLSTTVASVVLERVFDLFALFGFGLWVASSLDVPPIVAHLTWVVGGVLLAMFGGILAVHFNRKRLLPLVDRVWLMLPSSIGQKLMHVEHEFLDALAIIADAPALAKLVIWSLYVWLVIALNFSLGLLALGLDVPFLPGGVTVTTLVALAVSVPGAPGFVGQFEWGCKVALEQIYSVPGDEALAFSVVVHAVQWSTQVVLGLVYLVREGLSLTELERLPSEASEHS